MYDSGTQNQAGLEMQGGAIGVGRSGPLNPKPLNLI